jgi:outer membrane protein assembly factor BamB
MTGKPHYKSLYISILTSIVCFFVCDISLAQNFSEWRGKGRTGVYSDSGLLKQWPENGPELLWYNDSIPAGYSSVAIANNIIYVTGIIDTMDVLIALDIKGKELWRKPYGKAWNASFPESRCTPTVENDQVFVSSGKGDVACINALNGNINWSVNTIGLFDGKFGRWGLAESLLIDENNVYFTTGGEKTTMVALDKLIGKLIWQSESIKDNASYTSPLMIEKNGNKLIVNVTENYIIGIRPNDGKIVWKFDLTKYKKERSNKTNTPLYYDGGLYFTSGYNHTGIKLNLKDDLCSVELSWTDTVLDNHLGGVVKVGNYIYGSNWINNDKGNWVCIDWNTGKKQYETEWKTKGSIISADGMFILCEEKSGHVALVKADPKEFKIICSFKIPKGNGPLWAHPVINNGVLYIRHGNALMAYKIKEE